MKLQVSSVNEYKFYPDVADNLSLEEKKRFTVVLKKINRTLHNNKYVVYENNGKDITIDYAAKLKLHIVRIENPPMLEIDKLNSREMVISDLLDDQFEALYGIVEQIFTEITRLEGITIETKKL